MSIDHSAPKFRVSVARHLPQALQSFGVDSHAFFAAAGINSSAFDRGSSFVDFAELASLLSQASSVTRCNYLGMLIGRYGSIASTCSETFPEMAGATVSEAMSVIITSYRFNDQGGWVDLVENKKGVSITYVVCDPRVRSGSQIALMAITFLLCLMRVLCGSSWSPDFVELPMRRIDDDVQLRRFFRCDLRYDEAAAQIGFQREVLLNRVAPKTLSAIVKSAIDPLPISSSEEKIPTQYLSDELMCLVVQRLLAGRSILAAEVSTDLTLSRRTVHRRLKSDGLHYRELRSNVLAGLARRLLRDTALPVTEVAILLGYSELSAFTRAFTGWHGQSPRRFKEACRALA
jgi:AraC-like DNA-binding protein